MIGIAILSIACRTAPSAPKVSAATPRGEPASFVPLDYVPAAGLRWLVVGHPAAIFADRELAPAISEVASAERVAAFTSVTGIEPRTLADAVVAGYDLGTLYVTALPHADGGRARSLFEKRLSAGAIVKQPRPELFRIAGTRDGTPRAVVAVSDRLFAYAVGDPTLARVAEAYAERRLKSPTALRGAALSTLPPAPDALVVLYAPGPFTGPWSKAAGGLLRDALAARVAVRRGDHTLRVDVTITGDWPSDDGGALLTRAWTELSTSSTGRLFGLGEAKNLSSVANLHELTWSAELPLAALVAGLRAATVANVPEIFDVRAGNQTGSPDEVPSGQ